MNFIKAGIGIILIALVLFGVAFLLHISFFPENGYWEMLLKVVTVFIIIIVLLMCWRLMRNDTAPGIDVLHEEMKKRNEEKFRKRTGLDKLE